MKKRNGLLGRERGSITVEASLSMVFFTSVMIILLSIINICRVQSAINHALNISALEMSQYSYFYEVTGLYSLDRNMHGAGEPAGETVTGMIQNADTSIAGVESIYNLIGSSGKALEGTETPTDVLDTYKTLKGNYENAKTNVYNISDSIKALGDQVDGIVSNPMDFVKSLAAMGVSGGMDEAKSHLIAAPLARALVAQHIGNGRYADDHKTDADRYLKAMGIKEGLDGLNFNMSTLFSKDAPLDVNLVVAYELEVISLPFVGPIKIQFAQSASTRGWLGGDETIVPAPAPAESPPPNEEGYSVWNLGNLDRGLFFKDMLKKTHAGTGIVTAQGTQTPYAYDKNTNTFYHCISFNAFASSYNNASGFKADFSAGKINGKLLEKLEKIKNTNELPMEDGGKVTIDQSRPKHVECLVIIPEDTPPEVESALLQALNTQAQADNSKTDGVTVSFRIARGGGNAKPAEAPAETPAEEAA
ncbi:MAG: hypothetical protein LBC26_04035 [Oscillospiraceae bacterium]|jgi:hypothetical protein|nr:hypothetical protein [Oscillospiraceae bacterium]